MGGRAKRTLVSIVAVGLFAAAGAAHAEPANDADRVGGVVYDVTILRTTSLLKMAVGSVLWIPAYPLSLASEQRSTVTESLVTGPALDTFTRPLGDF